MLNVFLSALNETVSKPIHSCSNVVSFSQAFPILITLPFFPEFNLSFYTV